MPSFKSSMPRPLPIIFKARSALLIQSGSGIRTLSLPQKPSCLPSSCTAMSAPRSSAALTPAPASFCVRSARDSAWLSLARELTSSAAAAMVIVTKDSRRAGSGSGFDGVVISRMSPPSYAQKCLKSALILAQLPTPTWCSLPCICNR